MAKTIKDEALKLRKNIDDVYEAGQKAEYDRFWDSFQENGKRTNYRGAFTRWTADTFIPKHPIIPEGDVYQMFRHFNLDRKCDFAEHLEKNNIVLDFSKATESNYLFYQCSNLTRVGVIDISNCTDIANTFFQCSSLVTIDKLIFNKNGHKNYYTPLHQCTSLENVTIEGVISNNFDVNTCTKLTHESLMSIINALKDFRSTREIPITIKQYEYGDYRGVTANILSTSVSDGVIYCTTDNGAIELFASDINETDLPNLIRIESRIFDWTEEGYPITEEYAIIKADASITKTLTLPKNFENIEISGGNVVETKITDYYLWGGPPLEAQVWEPNVWYAITETSDDTVWIDSYGGLCFYMNSNDGSAADAAAVIGDATHICIHGEGDNFSLRISEQVDPVAEAIAIAEEKGWTVVRA